MIIFCKNTKEINKIAKSIWNNYTDNEKRNHFATMTGIKTEHVDLTGMIYSLLPKYVKMSLKDDAIEKINEGLEN